MPQDKNFINDVVNQSNAPEILPGDLIIGTPENYWLSQRDNKLHPSVTCFPTSVAMVSTYLLFLLGKSKEEIDIEKNEQIEDYITKNAIKSSMIQWMIRVLGSKMNAYAQRSWVVAKVEEKIFDDMFRQFGYDAILMESATFDDVCDTLIETNMPMVISGDYRNFSPVQGHITCVCGCNRQNGELLINDPFGDAYGRYTSRYGARRRYKFDDFYNKWKKNGEPATWALKFTTI